MASPLGPTQRLVLEVLDRWPTDSTWPTARQIADTIAFRAKTRTDLRSHGATSACLTRLDRNDHAEREWSHLQDAWVWAITPAGRDALKDASDVR